MIKFNNLNWLRKNMRGREFPFHGKVAVYLKDGDEIRFNSGNTAMMQVCFKLGGSWWFFGPPTTAVLVDDDGKYYDYNNFFITEDGKDPRRKGRIGKTNWVASPRQGMKFNKELTLTVFRSKGKVKLVYVGAKVR